MICRLMILFLRFFFVLFLFSFEKEFPSPAERKLRRWTRVLHVIASGENEWPQTWETAARGTQGTWETQDSIGQNQNHSMAEYSGKCSLGFLSMRIIALVGATAVLHMLPFHFATNSQLLSVLGLCFRPIQSSYLLQLLISWVHRLLLS